MSVFTILILLGGDALEHSAQKVIDGTTVPDVLLLVHLRSFWPGIGHMDGMATIHIGLGPQKRPT